MTANRSLNIKRVAFIRGQPFKKLLHFESTVKEEMALSKEERIDIVLHGMIGTYREIAEDFNLRHPERQPITHSAVVKLITKFKETGSVEDRLKVEDR